MSEAGAQQLQDLFKQCFYGKYFTFLQGGAAEPLYQPASWPRHCHTIYYREDFFASALHEVAHWCIAGAQRRQQIDYGYWYHPDGRGGQEQQQFEAAECKPQALEWHFALACNWPFRISNDNLGANQQDSTGFTDAVRNRAIAYCKVGLPPRAERFRWTLAHHFGGIAEPAAADFSPESRAAGV